MDLFTYLMAKNGQNTGKDLFSYLLGKKASGGSGTYTTFSGTSLNISNTIKAAIKKFMLNSTELTQDGTPTPDTPQDIHVITGSNNIKISGEVEEQNYPITLSSKNLALNDDPSNPDTNYRSSGAGSVAIQYDTAEEGFYTTGHRERLFQNLKSDKYTISLKAKKRASGSYAMLVYFRDSTGTNSSAFQGAFISPSQLTDDYLTYSKTYTLPQGYDIIDLVFYNTAYWKDIQLEEGSTATPYTPYFTPIEYCKIGDYADQIFKNTTDSEFYDSTLELNEWYLKKNIDKDIYDESGTWLERVNSAGVKQFYHNRPSGSPQVINYKQFCNYFSRYSSSVYNWGVIGDFAIFANPSQLFCCVSDDTTLEDFKSKLAIENLIVYYVLATPQYIHVSQTDYPTLKTQLDNLYNNAKSYNGTTNITQTNDDLPFNISVDVKVANL